VPTETEQLHECDSEMVGRTGGFRPLGSVRITACKRSYALAGMANALIKFRRIY
jgi:hypothetical protein